jgi:hypothetical protein
VSCVVWGNVFTYLPEREGRMGDIPVKRKSEKYQNNEKEGDRPFAHKHVKVELEFLMFFTGRREDANGHDRAWMMSLNEADGLSWVPGY